MTSIALSDVWRKCIIWFLASSVIVVGIRPLILSHTFRTQSTNTSVRDLEEFRFACNEFSQLRLILIYYIIYFISYLP